MASEMYVDTIAASDGTSPATLTKQVAPKIWSKTAGVTAVIADSFNLSSSTDVALGRFTLTYTNNMSDANYAAMFSSAWSGQDTTQVEQSAGQTSSDVDAWHFNVSNSYADADEYYYTSIGDLA